MKEINEAEIGKGSGDPEGKRLGIRKAECTEEASRIAECLAMFLRRADLPDTVAKEMAKQLRIEAIDLYEKSSGRLESRITVKNTGHPLLEGRKMSLLYLDESGTASLKSNDKIFALGGVCMNEEDVKEYSDSADRLKVQFFGTKDKVFHEPAMRRHDEIFHFGGDIEKQVAFDQAFLTLVKSTPFKAFGVGIRKEEFKKEFLVHKIDPYLPSKVYDLAIMLMIERFVDFLGTNGDRRLGRVYFESIGPREDAEHQVAYADLLVHGTQYVSQRAFQSWVEAGCRFNPKTGSNPAELADLVAREVFEWTRSDCQRDSTIWKALNDKVYCRGDGRFGKFGIKVFPSSDIMSQIDSHKVLCGAKVRN